MGRRRPQNAVGRRAGRPGALTGWHGHGTVPDFVGQAMSLSLLQKALSKGLILATRTHKSIARKPDVSSSVATGKHGGPGALRHSDTWVRAVAAMPVVVGGVAAFVGRRRGQPWLLQQNTGVAGLTDVF